MSDTVPTEIWWHVAKRIDNVSFLFDSWARTCKTFHHISLDTGVYQHMALYSLGIPKDYYRCLKAKGHWLEILKRWYQYQKYAPYLETVQTWEQRRFKFYNQQRRRVFNVNHNWSSFLVHIKSSFGLIIDFKHILCCVCQKPTAKETWRRLSSSFYCVKGNFICRRCAGDVGHGRIKVLPVSKIGPSDGIDCLDWVRQSNDIWTKRHNTASFYITQEDYEQILYEHLSDDRLLEKHRQITMELEEYDQKIEQILSQRKTLTDSLNDLLKSVVSELNDQFQCSVRETATTITLINILTTIRKTITYTMHMQEYGIMNLDQQLEYYRRVEAFIQERLPEIQAIQVELRRFNTVPRSISDKRVRLRKQKLFWYGLLKRRGLLKCSAIIIDGKRRCCIRTDGIHRLCTLHLRQQSS